MLNSMKRWLFFPLICTFLAATPTVASADVAGLVPCKDSAVFQRRLEGSVKKLTGRLANYEEGTPAYLSLEAQIQKTKVRFEKYGKQGLLCGADGLPHLIADGRWSHAAEFILPGFGFIYTTGWIGWVGRKYLRAVSKSSNPAENEIIINVPLALKIMTSGYIWPISAWQELISGELVASDDEVTVSPR